MLLSNLAYLFIVALSGFASAELFSDVESTESDQAKALEVKAKDFWQGLMESSAGLQTTENARLSAKVDRALNKLAPEDEDLREAFEESIGYLAKADSMLFDEASKSQELARARLAHGPSADAFSDVTSGKWVDTFYKAVCRFTGQGTYEKRLARHVISRLKDIKPTIHDAVGMAPSMLEESSKASDRAYEILRSRDGGKKGDLPLRLRELAHEIIRATGKQRLRFTNYLFDSLMTTAEDIAGKDEAPAKTVIRSNLRGLEEAVAGKPAARTKSEGAVSNPEIVEPKLIFVGGVPVDAKPIVDYDYAEPKPTWLDRVATHAGMVADASFIGERVVAV